MTDQDERIFRQLLPDADGGCVPHSHIGAIGGVFDELDVGVVSLDPAGDFAHVNRTAADLLAIPAGETSASAFEPVVRTLAARALNQTEVAALMRSADTDAAAAFKSTWVFADKPTHLGVVCKPAPNLGAGGRMWAFYDNSHVAAAVDAAMEANALLRASADAMMDPHVVLELTVTDGTTDLVYRDVNEAACAYFGLTRDEMIGHSLLDSGLRERYAACAETGQPVILDAFPYHSEVLGVLRYYDVRAVQVRPGLIMVNWRDVTERIESERRLAASADRFRLLADNVADVVALLDDDSTIRWMSKSAERTLGAVSDRWIGRRAVDVVPSEHRQAAASNWAQVAGGTYIGRMSIHGADGRPHTIHLHSKPFYDSQGNRDGVVVSFRVIDDEVAAERRAREQIEARNDRLKSQLDSAARYVASILPDDLTGRVAVTSRYLPSAELGGDSYDFRWVDDNHVMFYLVDVSGHGVEPALLSVSVHNLLRSGTFDTETLLRPDAVLTELNRLFQMDRQDGHYFTIWYGVYDAANRTLRYANAGHPPALMMADGMAPVELSATSIPIGLEADSEFAARSRRVPAGADVVLYSDGALELGMPQGQMPLSQFTQVCARISRNPDWTLDTLIAELRDAEAAESPVDDCTVVRLRIS